LMGRGGSDNYKINAGDTLGDDGSTVVGSYGVAGDVINEIGGSSEDKSDAITLSSAKSVDELTFSRTEIASEYWGNTLQIDVAYTNGGTDTLFVFDHYNQNLESRAVEQLFLDDGWDSNEIWNLIVGDVNGTTGIDEYIGTAGQDVLIAGTEKSTLYGGSGQDVMIGDNYSKETTFELGNKDGAAWDQVADIIQGFGDGDKLDLSGLGITAKEEIQVSGNELQVAADNTVIAEFSNFNDSLTLEQLLTEEGAIIYASAS
jgi:Ca2+-binding RTX toxin-like protein